MLLAALVRSPRVIDEPAPVVGVRSMTDDEFAARVWVPGVDESQSVENVVPSVLAPFEERVACDLDLVDEDRPAGRSDRAHVRGLAREREGVAQQSPGFERLHLVPSRAAWSASRASFVNQEGFA